MLSSRTHLIEIDLLRSGQPRALMAGDVESHYRVLVSRSEQRPQADLYAFSLENEIPLFAMPLKDGDQEPVIDLHALLNQVYDRAGYEVVIDYASEPEPVVRGNAADWMESLLKQKGLR